MKQTGILACFLFAATFFVSSDVVAAETEIELEGRVQKLSYAIGMQIAESLRMNDMELDIDIVLRGIKDAYTDAEPLMSQPEVEDTFAREMEEQARLREAEADANLEKSRRFLEENRIRDDVNVTQSGLQYEVIAQGDGETPGATDVVEVHYVGRTIEGEVFDSSRERGEPAAFPMGGIVPGLQEGIRLMRVGASYRFFLPPDQAYGESGVGRAIGPNEALIFEIELLDVLED